MGERKPEPIMSQYWVSDDETHSENQFFVTLPLSFRTCYLIRRTKANGEGDFGGEMVDGMLINRVQSPCTVESTLRPKNIAMKSNGNQDHKCVVLEISWWYSFHFTPVPSSHFYESFIKVPTSR